MDRKKAAMINPNIFIFLYILSGILFCAFPFTQASVIYAKSSYENSLEQDFAENGIQYEKRGNTVVDTKQGLTYKFHSKTNSYSLYKAELKVSSISIPDKIPACIRPKNR